METTDRLGRRRTPEQSRGLRPLHTGLPAEWSSRAIRVAMSEADWARFEAVADALAALESTPTQARALGRAIASLLDHAERTAPGSPHWMDWERRKTLRLLRFAI